MKIEVESAEVTFILRESSPNKKSLLVSFPDYKNKLENSYILNIEKSECVSYCGIFLWNFHPNMI